MAFRVIIPLGQLRDYAVFSPFRILVLRMWHMEDTPFHTICLLSYLLHNFGSYWLQIFDISNIVAFRGFPGNCNNSSGFHQKCPWTLLSFSLCFVTCAKGKRPETSGTRLLWIVWWREGSVSCKLFTRLMSLQLPGSLLFVEKRGLHVQSWFWSLGPRRALECWVPNLCLWSLQCCARTELTRAMRKWGKTNRHQLVQES